MPAPEKKTSKKPPARKQAPARFSDCIPLGTLSVPYLKGSFAASTDWKRAVHSTNLVPAKHELAGVFMRLEIHGKLIIAYKISPCDSEQLLLRIYVQPDDRKAATSEGIAWSDGQLLLSELDSSSAAWNGIEQPDASRRSIEEDADQRSLFYFFNTLPSPKVNASLLSDAHTKEAIHHVLNSDQHLPGLKTRLYPYQQRSAAVMIQREESPEKLLHPLLELKTAANGSKYYYNPYSGAFLFDRREFPACRGGILAETMGLGYVYLLQALRTIRLTA